MKNLKFSTEEDILESINLTAKLQKCLKKVLTNKKKPNRQTCGYNCQHTHQEQSQRLTQQITTLRNQKQLLLQDNQYLSKQLLSFKQEIRTVSKELRELKKYILFLQDYNCNLKKQMAFWVKKPKNQSNYIQHQSKYQVLSNQIDHLRKLNDSRQRQLQLEKTNNFPQGGNNSKDQFAVKNIGTGKKVSNNSISLRKKQNQCTSCSYQKNANNNIKIYKTKSTGGKCQQKNKKLCPCHKSYIQTSDFLY